MNHEIRRTSAKLHRRLDLVAANRARESVSIEAFELQELGGSDVDAQRWLETADPAAWQPIPWGSTWGRPRVDVILRSRFTVPSRWSDDASSEVRLWLPIGRSGDFSHPEALVHVDGVPLAACDRHHQEIVLPDRYCDGASHQLVLHGWTGGVPEVMGPRRAKPPLVMSECSVQLVDRGVARFESLARVALGVADELDVDDPVRAGLYDALDAAFLTLDTREPLGDRFFESAANSSPTTSDPRRRAGCCGCRTCTATPGISRNSSRRPDSTTSSRSESARPRSGRFSPSWKRLATDCRSGTASCTSNTTVAPTHRRQQRNGVTGEASSGCTTPSSWRHGPECSPVRSIGNGFEMVNGQVRVVLDGDGQVTELIDLDLGRSVMPAGEVGNRLQAFEDRPLDFDAWDIEIYYEDRQWAPEPAHSARIVESGPLRVAVLFERRLGSSTIAQTVTLRHSSKRIDFVTDIDWHERHTLLKVAFPVSLLNDGSTATTFATTCCG